MPELLEGWFLRWRQMRADRRRRTAAAKFNAGYAYARACLRRTESEYPEIHLMRMVESTQRSGTFADFDRGIERALQENPPQ